jgi:DNA modification methylase
MRAGLTGPTNKMGRVVNDDRADWQEAWKLFPGDVAYVWSAPGPLQIVSHGSLLSAGFEVRQQIIWAKDRFALGRGHYHYQHEPCWYAVRGTGHWAGDRKQTTLWNIPARDDSGHGHSTQKPVECMRRPIENNSSVGQAVYDPFLGSGTTLIAAEMTGRICHALEIDPGYCDVAVTRWENFTGKKAERRPAQNADAA